MIVRNKIYLAILLMIAGSLIYLFFREPVIFTMPFLNVANHFPLISLPDNILSYTLRFIIPDVFWCLALLIYISMFKSKILKYIAAIMPIFMELGQLMGFVLGTFDIVDLVSYFIITVIFILRWKNSELSSLQFSAV